MNDSLSRGPRRFQGILDEVGYAAAVRELADSTRTAREAADALGCEVAQIAKSLVFRGASSDQALLVIASGTNRVDENRLADLAGEPIARADADFVRTWTGYAIGGVPPLGHARELRTWIDQDLLQYEVIWAAAGSPRAVFPLAPGDLPRLTGGTLSRVAGAS